MSTDPRSIPYQKPRRVFITNMVNHDYTPLLKIGELVPVTEGRQDIRYTDKIRAKIEQVLETMNPDDLLCISGHSLVAVECSAIVQKKFGRVRYVFWESFTNKYVERDTQMPDDFFAEVDPNAQP